MVVRGRRALIAGLAISIATTLAAHPAWSADEPAPAQVLYQDDALSIHVTGVPLSEILDEVARQSGAKIRGQPREARDVQADFDSVPLPQALARLLPDQNFALVYGISGCLERIRLIGGTAEPAAIAVVPARVPKPPSVSWLGRLSELIDHHPPVAVDGVLADAVGSGKASLRELIELSLYHDDEAVRAEAVRVGMATLDGEPDFRSAVMEELSGVDSGVLTALLRDSGSDHAEDVAMHVLDRGALPELKVKASAVVQRIRAGL